MRTVRPPTSIEDEMFVLIWERETDTYVLALKDGRTYDLGSAQDTLIYFRNVLEMEAIGQRAMDCARNFYTAVALVEGCRVFGAETEESKSEYKKLFQVEETPFLVV